MDEKQHVEKTIEKKDIGGIWISKQIHRSFTDIERIEINVRNDDLLKSEETAKRVYAFIKK